ncbi:MAG: hypothetical protein QW735_03665 [archaeon]
MNEFLFWSIFLGFFFALGGITVCLALDYLRTALLIFVLYLWLWYIASLWIPMLIICAILSILYTISAVQYVIEEYDLDIRPHVTRTTYIVQFPNMRIGRKK